MDRVLVIGANVKTLYDVKRILQRMAGLDVQLNREMSDLESFIEQTIYSLVVVCTSVLTQQTIDHLNSVRKKNRVLPVLFVIREVDPEIRSLTSAADGLHLLLEPIHERNLTPMVTKLLISRKIPKQHAQRFNTDVVAHVESLVTGTNLLTNMYNLSESGAYCEYQSDRPISIGDILRLKVVLNEAGSERVLNAKVVWTTPHGRFSGKLGIGLRFMSAKESYRALMMRG